jgi:hypothetical protein
LAVLAGVALLAACAGCSMQPGISDNRLAAPESGGSCLPLPRYSHVAFGVLLNVEGTGSITVEKVRPVGVVNVRVASLSFMRSVGSSRLYADVWPLMPNYTSWKDAVPTTGAVLKQGSQTDLVLETLPIDPTKAGTIKAVRIDYTTAQGLKKTLTTEWRYKLSVDACDDF